MGLCFSSFPDESANRPPATQVIYVSPPVSAQQQQRQVLEGYGYPVSKGEDPTPPTNWIPQAQGIAAYPISGALQYPMPSAPPYYTQQQQQPQVIYVQQQQRPPQQGMGVGTAMIGGFVLGSVLEDVFDNDF